LLDHRLLGRHERASARPSVRLISVMKVLLS
jgi:hypothetical protein